MRAGHQASRAQGAGCSVCVDELSTLLLRVAPRLLYTSPLVQNIPIQPPSMVRGRLGSSPPPLGIEGRIALQEVRSSDPPGAELPYVNLTGVI